MSSFEFKHPLGLVLSGGGALAAWQAGCLDRLAREGLVFDHVLGFSSGSLNGTLYCLRREGELVSRWSEIGGQKVFELSPRRRPPSLFSETPLRGHLAFARDDAAVRRDARCPLTVVSLCLDDGMPVYSRFSPIGKGAWDAPLASWVVSSCAIPWVFPPVALDVRGERRLFADGGIPGREWMRFDALAGCKDVIVLEMVRADEVGLRRWGPLARLEQKSREVVRRQIDSGVDSLARLPEPPRVFRLAPSRILEFYQLSFRTANCLAALKLGAGDAERFLADPRWQGA